MVVAHVRVQLLVSSIRSVATVQQASCPRCAIEVWAEDGEGARLVECRGSLCPDNSHMHVHWLGRRREALSQACGPGWNYVSGEEPLAHASSSERRTLAQALLGILASVGELFGMIIVDMEAEDNGSGKLIRFYEDMGLTRRPKKVQALWMEGPIKSVAQLAPQKWLLDILPEEFDAWNWLQRDARDCQVERLLLSPDVPWKWAWTVAWPANSQVDMRMRVGKIDNFSKIGVEAVLKSSTSTELAFARGAVRLKHRTLKLLWLGRTASRPVHSSVKGHLAYECDSECQASGEDCKAAEGRQVTAAVALLGALASFGCWVGAATVEILALDDGSGQLFAYLQSFGFAPQPGRDESTLFAPCSSVALRCCPGSWRRELPPEGQLGILAKLAPQ